MFFAKLVSLSDGQSYKDVEVCESSDLDIYNIPRIFEEWTGCIFVDGECIIIHHWKFRIIHVDNIKRGGANSFEAKRIILDGNIVYGPVTIIPHDTFTAQGIPHFFEHNDRGGIVGQLTFSTGEGTFITHDTNVTSLMIDNPRKFGMTGSKQGIQTQSAKLKYTPCNRIIK